MYTWPNRVNRSASSARRISISQPRSSAMRRRGLTLTPSMACFPATEYFTGAVTFTSPADANLGIVPQHEPIRRRLYRKTIDPHVLPNQAVLDAGCQIADPASLEND